MCERRVARRRGACEEECEPNPKPRPKPEVSLRRPVCVECLVGKQNKPTLLKVTEPVAEEEEEEEDLFVFNDTIEGPRAPAVKPGRVTQA